MKITGGELVVLSLKKYFVDKVFTLVGNHLSPILVHAHKHQLEVIDVRHEQAAVHMADGYAQTTRTPGVAMVVGGPGFTNSITGIVKAYMANTPMLVIVGASVPQQKDCGGLQDMNQIGMIKEYTRWAATVYDVKRIPEYINIAIKKSISGKKGPVVLEIPINVLRTELLSQEITWPLLITNFDNNYCDDEVVDLLIDSLTHCKKPVIIAGDEVYYQRAEKELLDFVEATGIPVYTVNKARGCIPDSHELCFGNGRVLEAGPGLYSYKNADCIINIGLYIDYQMNFCKPPTFGEDIKIITLCKDVSANSHFTSRDGILVAAHIPKVLEQLTEALKKIKPLDFSIWMKELKMQETKYWEELYSNEKIEEDKIHPIQLISNIGEVISEDSIIILDGSNAMFWGGLLFKCNYPGQMIIGPDGTFGPMGCGIPLALAAKLENQNRSVILYTGDGSFGFNAIEIDTALRLNIPIIIVIHNDKSWGFCKSTQLTLYGEDGIAATDLGMRRYDKMVEAMGGYGELVTEVTQIKPAMERAIHSNKIACINILVDENDLAPGANMFNKSLKIME